MVITKENYKQLKDQVEGKYLDKLSLNETYTALCYLTHRLRDEHSDKWWTAAQINIVKKRQKELLTKHGIYVLRG